MTASRSPLTATRPFKVFDAWNSLRSVSSLGGSSSDSKIRSSREMQVRTVMVVAVGPVALSSNTFRHESNASFGMPRGGVSQNFPINAACSADISPELKASAISGCRLSILPNARIRAAAGTSSNVFAASHCLTLRKPRVSNETARSSISATMAARSASSCSIAWQISRPVCTSRISGSVCTSPGRGAVTVTSELSPPGFMTQV
ncbi:hypothetical protein ABIC73_000065 [Prescottella equi]